MSFFSLQFLIFFLVLFVLYYTLPKKFQWVLLLTASAYFYATLNLSFAVFLVFSITITYICGLVMGKVSKDTSIKLKAEGLNREDKKQIKQEARVKKQGILAVILLLNLGLLAFFKYYQFFDVFSSLSVIMPLGISFYTFTSIGYCIDVYREEYEPIKNPLKYALFVSFFPHIMQGPISKFSNLAPDLLKEHDFEYKGVTNGLKLMSWGFIKKFVFAGHIEIFINMVAEKNSSGLILAVTTALYAFYIYADFSGYMDIVKGISSCLGVKLTDNFLRPYFSKNVSEYWRRWHFTLGEWFRNYLFYPVVRAKWCQKFSKASKHMPAVIGLLIVWLCTGIWHGATLHYVIWGLYYGVLIISALLLNKVFDRLARFFRINVHTKLFRYFQVLRTFFLVCIGYVFFQQPSMGKAVFVFRSVAEALINLDFSLNINNLGLPGKTLIITALAPVIIVIVWLVQRKGSIIEWITKQNFILRYVIYALALWSIVLLGAAFGENKFIYFQF